MFVSRNLRRFVVATIIILAPGAVPVAAASPKLLKIIDNNTRSEWIMDQRAWGGGVRFYFPNAKHESGPSGLTPNFALGCSSIDPAKSYWRFLVEFAPLGSGATGEDENAYVTNQDYYSGAPGTVVLFDEMDLEFKRLPLPVARSGGRLETGPLTREDVKSITDASRIRVETPRILLETRALLAGGLNSMSGLPCGAR